METDENDKELIPHKANTTQVGFWLDKDVLALWDGYAKAHKMKRTRLIIEAVNEKIAGIHVVHDTTPVSDPAEVAQRYVAMLRTELQATVRQLRAENQDKAPNSVNAILDTQIKTFMKIVAKNLGKDWPGCRSDDIAKGIGADHDGVVTMMTSSEDYKMDTKGYWKVVKNK